MESPHKIGGVSIGLPWRSLVCRILNKFTNRVCLPHPFGEAAEKDTAHAPTDTGIGDHGAAARGAGGGAAPDLVAAGPSAGDDHPAPGGRREPDGGGARSGRQPPVGDQVGAALPGGRDGGARRRRRARAQAEHRRRGARADRPRRHAAAAGPDALVGAQHGAGDRRVQGHGAAAVARQRHQAARHADVQAVERPALRGEVLGRGRAVSGPAGAGPGAVLRREEPMPGAGAQPARLSRPAGLQPHADARLQAARHGHAVRRAVVPGRQDSRPDRRPAHAQAVARVPPPPEPRNAPWACACT